MTLSGSRTSGGVGVGVGFNFGGGGGSPSVGAIRSVCGLCVWGVGEGTGVDTGLAGPVAGGVGVAAGVCVLRGRSWLKPLGVANALEPKINPESTKPQTTIIPVRLRFCSLNNLKTPQTRKAGANGAVDKSQLPERTLPKDAGKVSSRCRKPRFLNTSARVHRTWRSSLPSTGQTVAGAPGAASPSPSHDATCHRSRRPLVCNR